MFSNSFDTATPSRDNDGRKDELNDIFDNLEFKMDTSEVDEMIKGVLTDGSQDSQESQRSNISNTANNKLQANLKPTHQMHANLNALQSMVSVDGIQQKAPTMLPEQLKQPPKNTNIGIQMDQQSVPHQQTMIAQQSILEKSVQQPLQMQINQRALTNQPIHQTIQTLSQIEPMQQSPVDNKIPQKIG